MVESIGSSQQSYSVLNQQVNRKPPGAEEMFQKLTSDLGGDGNSISKEDLENYISELEANGSSEEKGKLGFLNQLASNFDTISGGSDSITVEDLDSNMDLLKPQGGPQGAPPPPKDDSNQLSSLLDSIDTDDDGVTKTDLLSYLENTTSSSNTQEVDFINKLIDNFDNVSTEDGFLTVDSFDSYMQNMDRFGWQDPSTITSEQLETPINIKV